MVNNHDFNRFSRHACWKVSIDEKFHASILFAGAEEYSDDFTGGTPISVPRKILNIDQYRPPLTPSSWPLGPLSASSIFLRGAPRHWPRRSTLASSAKRHCAMTQHLSAAHRSSAAAQKFPARRDVIEESKSSSLMRLQAATAETSTIVGDSRRHIRVGHDITPLCNLLRRLSPAARRQSRPAPR